METLQDFCTNQLHPPLETFWNSIFQILLRTSAMTIPIRSLQQKGCQSCLLKSSELFFPLLLNIYPSMPQQKHREKALKHLKRRTVTQLVSERSFGLGTFLTNSAGSLVVRSGHWNAWQEVLHGAVEKNDLPSRSAWISTNISRTSPSSS